MKIDPNILGGELGAVTTEFGPLLSSLGGEIVILRPLYDDEVPTVINGQDTMSEATICQGIWAKSDGTFVDLGDKTPVFWTFVQTQLREQATPEIPWVVGKLVRGSRAWRLDAPTPEEMERAQLAFGLWKAAVEIVDAEESDPFDPDSEPL